MCDWMITDAELVKMAEMYGDVLEMDIPEGWF